jgi:hypothetical protein
MTVMFLKKIILLYRVFTIKRPDFEDVLEIYKFFFRVLRVSYILQELKFPPKFLGYLTGHRWGAVVISRKDGVSSGEGASCCVVF